jgi:hypothetical protein
LAGEDLGEDKLDKESQLLEDLQSKRESQYGTLKIAPRCRGDAIFVEERGINGESAHM